MKTFGRMARVACVVAPLAGCGTTSIHPAADLSPASHHEAHVVVSQPVEEARAGIAEFFQAQYPADRAWVGWLGSELTVWNVFGIGGTCSDVGAHDVPAHPNGFAIRVAPLPEGTDVTARSTAPGVWIDSNRRVVGCGGCKDCDFEVLRRLVDDAALTQMRPITSR